MSDAWVVNASPLICLAKAGRLSLLDEPGITVFVPDAVAAEILAGPLADPARTAIEGGFGRRISVDRVPERVVEWSLGSGESAVLAAALMQPGWIAILDDAEARSCARVMGVPVMGTLGLILRAQRLGRIEHASKVVSDLRAAGLFIDERIALKFLQEHPGKDP